MIIDMKCSNCGAPLRFDDSRQVMFCGYCGHKLVYIPEQMNINHQVNVSGTVQHVQNRFNDPNLYITYNTSNPAIMMVTRIVSTGMKNTYVNGQTLSFHLKQGKQLIVLKIGKRNYNREIVIPPDNSPVRIYASFNGHAQISIDQPYC
ncbi:MAG: zinc ribbon domain-containing protein [Clostridiales bacterium]|nr:zinc ribbon domain-containing protein [Clostridiales bacterium]